MPGLDSYLVTLGVKGQDVVLSTMDKIRKKGGALSKKKSVVNFAADTKQKAIIPAIPSKETTKDGQVSKREKKADKNEEQAGKTAQKFGGAVQKFAQAASSLDPVSTVQSVTSSIGTMFSGISILGVSLGRVPEGLAALANSTLSMAKSSVDMAKQSTLAYQQLSERNASTSRYGGEVRNSGQLSRNEMSMFVNAVSGSMGIIQKPLAAEINKLLETKDTRALAQVSAGDWESTGTDKGWMLQQIASGAQGLPPSIKQRILASLLSQNADQIQGYAPGQKEVQSRAAGYANLEEDQTKAIYERSDYTEVMAASKSFNTLQANMFDAGMKMTSAINAAAAAAEKLPQTISDTKKAIRNCRRL